MIERKQNLIVALERELLRLSNAELSTEDLEYAIEYLKTGKCSLSEEELDSEDYNITYSAINDLECLIGDYDC